MFPKPGSQEAVQAGGARRGVQVHPVLCFVSKSLRSADPDQAEREPDQNFFAESGICIINERDLSLIVQ